MTLPKREAKLRAEALQAILSARVRLDDGYGAIFWTAFRAVIRDRPKAALLAIARAEAHLAKAKRALRAWCR